MNIYIGNLSYSVKESDLKEVMEDYGTVDSVKLIIDRDTRRSKGFVSIWITKRGKKAITGKGKDFIVCTRL